MIALDRISSQIDLRGPVLVWVLGAHVYATLVPLALSFTVYRHWDYLATATDRPHLFHIAVALLCAGSAFEVAQNTFDRWYLTPESASANGIALCDMLFYWLITAGQGVAALAVAGDTWWVVAIALAAVLSLPVCYLSQVTQFAPLSVVGILVIVVAFQAFGDPVIFLQLLLTALTMYFFAALLRTGAQFLHGFTTAAASSGLWFLIWAITNGSAGKPLSGLAVILIGLAAIVIAATAWPYLARLSASERAGHPRSGAVAG